MRISTRCWRRSSSCREAPGREPAAAAARPARRALATAPDGGAARASPGASGSANAARSRNALECRGCAAGPTRDDLGTRARLGLVRSGCCQRLGRGRHAADRPSAGMPRCGSRTRAAARRRLPGLRSCLRRGAPDRNAARPRTSPSGAPAGGATSRRARGRFHPPGADAMKVLPSRGMVPSSPSLVRTASQASFHELLETGTSARAILGQRALGFSETGLLGLRFASAQRSAPPPRQAGEAIPARPLPAAEREISPSRPACLPNHAREEPHAAKDRASVTITGLNRAGPRVEQWRPSGPIAQDCYSRTNAASRECRETAPVSMPPAAKSPRKTRSRDPALRLFGKDGNIVILYCIFEISAEDCAIIEAVSHEMAKLFEVKIERVVVRSIANTHL